MKSILRILTLLVFIAPFASCNKDISGPTEDTPGQNEGETKDTTEVTAPEIFAKGADISWLTQMEADSIKFYNAENQDIDCIELLKKSGFNAIRLRVWVNPEDGWCGKEDILRKASRAYNLGMDLMIDFHYSDTWADPGNQNPPAEWKGYTIDEMTTAVKAHTTDILKGLDDLGIDVKWVQIGNEVNSGMLHPSGKIQDSNAANFVRLLHAGADAAKEIYPDSKTIIHISNGQDKSLFEWFFSLMQQYKVRYDIIGMSLYPVWWENGGWTLWKPVVNDCLTNIRTLIAKYDKPVMICELGMPVSEPQMSKEAIRYILDETSKIEKCSGVFYWEPQTDGVWKPAGYYDLGWSAYDKGAFKDGKPTEALDPFGKE